MSMSRIMGAGGGKGGGSPRVAVEAPDSLRSAQYAALVDVLCEGEIEGLVDGARSIYLNNTPIQGAGESMNFTGVSYQVVNGTQTQEHFPNGGVSVTQDVGLEVRFATPIVRTISAAATDWATVTVGVPRLSYQDPTNGDISGSSVGYAIEVQSAGGGYETVYSGGITGKTISRYQREHKIYLRGNAPWNIRVRRTSADSTQSNVVNAMFWDVLTTGIDVKLRYPNTAAVMLRVDSKQFSSVPTRGYDIRGLRVRVPVNYDPMTRVYTGSWDGTFKIAWTDNPAWCFYDLVTNTRYGLGEYISTDNVDKWALYQIARYCDELVPDGFGGMEPRFTCNLYMQTQEEAYRVVTSMASIFRAMPFWADDQITSAQDAPSDPVALFTPANVIEGNFNYQGADRRARHTVVLVSWNDPADFYKQKIEYVDDEQAIARWGVLPTEIVAVGCTSRGQAHRVGKWLLYTEQNESETITFRAGLDAARLAPGSIFVTQDPTRSGRRMGGRALAGTTATNLVLDAPVTIEVGQSYEVSVVLQDGTIATRNVVNAPGTHSALTLTPALPSVPLEHAMWVMVASNLQPEYWRAITVTEVEPLIVEITAVAHDPGKYAFVEQGLTLEPRITSAIPVRPGPVTNLQAETQMFRLNDGAHSARIALSWGMPLTGASARISWRRGDDNYRFAETTGNSFDIDNVAAGTYTIRVAALNALGDGSEPLSITHVVEASATQPDVTGLVLNPSFNGRDLPMRWNSVPGSTSYELELRDPTTDALLRAVNVEGPQFVYTFAMNVADGGPRRSLRVRVRARTLIGQSANWTQQTFTNAAPATPVGLTLEAGPGQVGIFAQRPADEDLAGMIVWMDTIPEVRTTEAYRIYQGTDNAYMKTGLQPGVQLYFRVAFYDSFGTTGLNLSSSVAATPLASGGVTQVTALPANPAAVGGELTVFLNVADPELRGLYGWDGDEWISVSRLLDGSVQGVHIADDAIAARHVVAGAITAQKISVSSLSALSANLGTMTAGNFTLDADGFIRGGAANWGAGTGFWQGFHEGAYRWRVGTPGGAGAAWDGTNFTIYGPDGSVTLQSGGSVGGSDPTAVSPTNPITAANASTYIANAAINAAQIGSLALVGTSNFSVRTALTGARMEMDSRVIKIFDASGVLRVQIGDLTL